MTDTGTTWPLESSALSETTCVISTNVPVASNGFGKITKSRSSTLKYANTDIRFWQSVRNGGASVCSVIVASSAITLASTPRVPSAKSWGHYVVSDVRN